MDPQTRRTVFHGWHKASGAHLVNFAGWEMPLNYPRGIVEEHLATRKFGGLFDVSHMGRLLIKGEGALSFLQYMLTNNAAALEPGHAQYTILANDRGGAIDDAFLYYLAEEEYLLVVNASNTGKDLLWLREHLKKFSGVTLEDQTATLAMAAFQGPATREILENLVKESGTRLPDPARNSLRKAVVEGVPVILSRTGYTGEPLAFEIFMPADGALKVWERIIQAGQGKGGVPVGLGARDTLRLEAGLPLYGHEFGTDADGKEIPILAVPKTKIAVSFSEVKGDYIGKGALWNQFQELKLREEGKTLPPKLAVPRRFYPLALISEGVARQNFPVEIGGQTVGYVSSGTMVPYWKFKGEGIASTITDETGRRAIALAYLPAGLKENQPVRVQSRGKFLEGIVVKRHLGAEIPPYARPVLVQEAVAAPPPPAESLEVAVGSLVKKAQANSRWRQKQTVNLIPSEQTPSPLVKLLSVADPCARYAEHRHLKPLGDAHVYYYQGTDFIEWVEERLCGEMGRYLGCSEVETRIISGQMANATVFSGLVDYCNRFDRKSEPRRLRKVMNHHLGRGSDFRSKRLQ